MARLRAEGRITEIGPADLALTREEAAALVRDAQVVLGEDDLTNLHQRTEGWAVGLYLAALYLREGGSLSDAAASFDGSDQFVSEYLESELLAQISPGQRLFLTRAAVLERMSGPLCEAVLDLPGSGGTLAGLARSNLLLVPLDHRGKWYRYHQPHARLRYVRASRPPTRTQPRHVPAVAVTSCGLFRDRRRSVPADPSHDSDWCSRRHSPLWVICRKRLWS